MKLLKLMLLMGIVMIVVVASDLALQANWFAWDNNSVMVSVTRQGGVQPFFGSISGGDSTIYFTPNDTNPHYYQVPISGRANLVVRICDSTGTVVEQFVPVYIGDPR